MGVLKGKCYKVHCYDYKQRCTWCGIEGTLMFAYIGKYNWLVVI